MTPRMFSRKESSVEFIHISKFQLAEKQPEIMWTVCIFQAGDQARDSSNSHFSV